MLRIDRLPDNSCRFTYALTGRVDASHLAELERLVAQAIAAKRAVQFDLSSVTLVDRDAIRFVAHGAGRRARLVGCPPYVEQWLRVERAGNQSLIHDDS